MTWFKVDDSMSDHPKFAALEASPHWSEAVALWTVAGSWCAKHLTDGNVPCTALRTLVPIDCSNAASELVRVGLWEIAEGGWRFHDWLSFQPSRASVLKKREKTKKRVDKLRKKRNAVSSSVRNAPRNTTPDPTRPDPSVGMSYALDPGEISEAYRRGWMANYPGQHFRPIGLGGSLIYELAALVASREELDRALLNWWADDFGKQTAHPFKAFVNTYERLAKPPQAQTGVMSW